MNTYEDAVIRLQKRIKKMVEDPDPTKLKSNKLLYEMQLETAKAQLEAWRQGKAFSNGPGLRGGLLARAMGFVPTGGGVGVFGTMESQKYLELARTWGLPVDSSCDMTSIPFAMAQTGYTPIEDVAICAGGCTPTMMSRIFTLHTNTTFNHYIDIGFEDNEANLEHVTNQLGEFIELAEKKFPGIKYDEDRLIELQAIQEACRGYSQEMYQMLKRRPSPIAGTDAFRLSSSGGGPSYPEPLKGLEYMRVQRDEMAERVEKGIAAVPGEKLRMLWTVTRPLFMDPFPILAKRKIAVILFYMGLVNVNLGLPRTAYWGGRKLTPLEKVAADLICDLATGAGSRWVNAMIWICRDLQIDAIINYCMLGCTASLGLRKLVEDAAEKELGIPTLQLEGKIWDSSYASEATITARLDEFAQMCLSTTGLA